MIFEYFLGLGIDAVIYLADELTPPPRQDVAQVRVIKPEKVKVKIKYRRAKIHEL